MDGTEIPRQSWVLLRIIRISSVTVLLTTLISFSIADKIIIIQNPFMEEKWKPIEGCEGHYQISNYGKI
ncbi:NUMOD4 domain-containing protein [Salinibacter pepae]|uniref:NUMOD4 domain-containing protein n=1 Tax=Salinibacter TaxID=146918 RepID=UPI003C6DDB41